MYDEIGEGGLAPSNAPHLYADVVTLNPAYGASRTNWHSGSTHALLVPRTAESAQLAWVIAYSTRRHKHSICPVLPRRRHACMSRGRGLCVTRQSTAPARASNRIGRAHVWPDGWLFHSGARISGLPAVRGCSVIAADPDVAAGGEQDYDMPDEANMARLGGFEVCPEIDAPLRRLVHMHACVLCLAP